MSRILAAGLLVATMLGAPLAAETRAASFPSVSLGHDVNVSVELPASYADGTRNYPVLYVLHGLFEGPRFWEGRGLSAILRDLQEKKEVPELIVVAVDGGNAFFVNGPLGRYEDLVTLELPAWVERNYRVAPGRAGRALLGVSMGGYGALRIALSHPEVFGAVATHSAMLLQQAPTPQEGAGRWHMSAFHRAFGDPIDRELWNASDPLALAARADADSAPALYFDCGEQDRYGLFAGNRELHARLAARGVRHEFALHPGDHGYEYVRTVLATSLRFLGHALAAGVPAAQGR